MDVIALLLAAVAAALSLTGRINFAFAALSVALICQFTHLTGHVIR